MCQFKHMTQKISEPKQPMYDRTIHGQSHLGWYYQHARNKKISQTNLAQLREPATTGSLILAGLLCSTLFLLSFHPFLECFDVGRVHGRKLRGRPGRGAFTNLCLELHEVPFFSVELVCRIVKVVGFWPNPPKLSYEAPCQCQFK